MKIVIVGCGVMGTAFARMLVKKGHKVILCDHHPDKGESLAKEIGATFLGSPKEAVKGVDLILLAIKPKDLKTVAHQIGELREGLLVSILSGTSIQILKSYFPEALLVRMMPNLALTCGEGVIAVVDDPQFSKGMRDTIMEFLAGMGVVFWTQEEKIDAITALAGSGPAFVIAIIEAMVESGIAMGLKAQEAQELVLQTILGAVALLKTHQGHPGEIRWKISAPGGTTIAGIQDLEKSGVRSGVMNTVLSTYRRAKELM